jgi:hypothetical protein
VDPTVFTYRADLLVRQHCSTTALVGLHKARRIARPVNYSTSQSGDRSFWRPTGVHTGLYQLKKDRKDIL